MVPLSEDDLMIQSRGLLANPDQYVACGVDLGQEAERRTYWLALFRNHFPKLLDEAVAEATARNQDKADVHERCQAAEEGFFGLPRRT